MGARNKYSLIARLARGLIVKGNSWHPHAPQELHDRKYGYEYPCEPKGMFPERMDFVLFGIVSYDA